jgi:CheY-like chemotaxis protein
MNAKRILIIDDEEDIREIAQVSLNLMKAWDVVTAASGEEGTKLAILTQPDAILLDAMMPEVDGVETLKRLQAHPATRVIPVIMLTGATQPSKRQIYLQAGARAIVQKPFDPAQLGCQIAAALEWAQT